EGQENRIGRHQKPPFTKKISHLSGYNSLFHHPVKFDGEKDFYAFNSWSYGSPKWKDPILRLCNDKYEVMIKVTTSGLSFSSSKFCVENPDKQKGRFRISNVNPKGRMPDARE
ncbi:MAG: hypothetical protein HYU30_08555, partial [Chloroflexi bacterium]|nr:hypothetical protein [Chloroflexota bacterium]